MAAARTDSLRPRPSSDTAHAKRSSKHTQTQAEAIQHAKDIVSNAGGGEVRIQGRDGRFRDSDTVAPGNDPHPPKDTKF